MRHSTVLQKCLIIAALSLLSVSLFAGAEMKFKAKDIEFGEVESGKVVDLKFEFENVGDSVLIIKNVASSCGCTTAKMEKKEYQPGEKGAIPAKFFSQGYSGKVVKSITITTNDEKNKHIILRLKGEVKLTRFAMAELIPDKVDFGEVKFGETYSKVVTLKNTGTIDLKIVEITHTPDFAPEFTKKVVSAGEEYKIKLNFTPMQAGLFSAFIKVRTNAFRRPVVLVKVSAEVKQ